MHIAKNVSPLPHKNVLHTARSELVRVTSVHVLIIALNVVIGLLVARHFSINNYGQLSYFINLFGLCRLLAALGITSQVTFELAQARGKGETTGNSFYSLLVLRVITLVGLIGLFMVLAYTRHDQTLMIAGLAAALALINDFGIGALQGLGLIRRVLSVLALQPILYACGALFVIMHDLPVEAIYLVFTLSFLCAILLAAVWLAGWVGLLPFDTTGLREVWSSLHFAGGMYFLGISGSLFASYTTLFLGRLERFSDAALIAIPLSLCFMPAVVVNAAMTSVYFPRMIEMRTSNDISGNRSLFGLFYGLVSAFTILVTVSLLLYPHVLLYLLYGGRYQASAPLLVLIAPVAYLYTMQTVLTFTIVAQGRIRASMRGAFASMIVLVVVITLFADAARDLYWFAAAHSIAALVGFIWQLRMLGYDLWQPLGQTAKQVLVAVALLGVGRWLVPDSVDRIFEAITALGLTTVIYVAWVWHRSGAGHKPF